MNRLYRCLFILPLILGTSFTALAQPGATPTPPATSARDANPRYCWDNEMRLEKIAFKLPVGEAPIIVIARLGERDRNTNLNKRRLNNVRAFLLQPRSAQNERPSESVIVAEGEKTKGFGQVEIYVDGRLVETLKARPNSDLAVTACYSAIEKDPCPTAWHKKFYPCKDRIDSLKPKVRRK